MNSSVMAFWVSGLLQLAVACYALRLNRLFGARRVGWSLFAAFSLLAVFHLLQSLGPSKNITSFGAQASVIYALVSLLLLTGMAHIEVMTRARIKLEAEQEKLQAQLQMRVEEKTTELVKANEVLQQEVAERQRVAIERENTYNQLLQASHQAGMTEVASSVLHNVGNVLNSVNISASLVADHLTQSKAPSVMKVAELMKEHANDLGDFITKDSRGQQLPGYLMQLAEHLKEEQTMLVREIGFVRKKIEHIKDIVAMQQSYAKVAGVTETVVVTDLVEDALQMNSDALARHDVEIIRDYDPHVREMNVEKNKVLQILVNLIRNAKYACDESGRRDKRMTLRVNNGGEMVRITVSDNGVGIPAANLTKIFTHGFTTRKGGHGFGLHGGAMSAEDMGGKLIAQSDGPGKGATFTLELPLNSKTIKA